MKKIILISLIALISLSYAPTVSAETLTHDIVKDEKINILDLIALCSAIKSSMFIFSSLTISCVRVSAETVGA